MVQEFSNSSIMKEIKIEERADDIKAYLINNPTIWGNGKTGYEAIGNLVANHPDTFKVKIILR